MGSRALLPKDCGPGPSPGPGGKCCAVLASGSPCRYAARDGSLCGVHARQLAAAVECPVCLGPVKKRARASMACGHCFHARCVRAWFQRQPLTCPMCRAVCLDAASMALLGPRMAPKLLALTRTLPPPERAFFPSYMLAHLENPAVVDALGADHGMVDLLVDLACECFTSDNFFAKVRAMGL